MTDKTPKHGILVAVDFSPNSATALKFAAEMAECMKAQLLVLHVVHDPGDTPGYYAQRSKKSLRKMEDIAAEMMAEFLADTAKANPDLKALKKADSKLVVGLPVARVLEVVDKTEPRLVVLGSRGRTGLSHLLLGSKAEQIVRLCPVPVTIVKDEKHKE